MAEADRARWDARYASEGGLVEPSAWITSLEEALPREGRALDVAGGAGRHALWLARRGLSVTLVDISPVGIRLAEERAREAGLTIEARVLDLDQDPLPAGPWNLIVQNHFLDRALFPRYVEQLAPGGMLVVDHPTRTNLQRHDRPGPAFLLEDGELPGLCAGLEVISYEEGWTEAGRHEARLIARKR